MPWPRPARRALVLLAAALLAAAGWSLLRPPRRDFGPGDGAPPLELRVDVNAASAAQLEAVPGIGPALAARIVAHRDRRGRFAAVEDLGAVPGVGPKTLGELRPYLEARRP